MVKRRRQFECTVAVMCVILLFLICFVLIEIRNTNEYNSLERTEFGPDEICNVEISPRGGTTDSWIKIMDGTNDHVGVIYQGVITNRGKYDMSEWSLRINIENDIYINNAWCGTVEIHQMRDGGELVQTLDLRNYKLSDITLEHRLADADLLIPLHKGDYIIYKPNQEVDEYPIMGTGLGTGNAGEVVIGLIFYYQQD